jgi:hypothetical protein
MKDDKKSSVIKEALIEFGEIQEAAVANAKKNLAETYPEKFNELLREELNKNKKTKESYKKIDENKETEKLEEVKTKKESVMKNQKEETKKVIKEGDKNQPFDKKAPENGPDVVKEEREKDFMGDVESDTPNLGKGETEDGDAFEEKITTKKETVANKTSIKEEFDITELDMQSVGSALENAEDDDEVITMDEIESEIQEMDNLEEELSDMGGLPRPELEKRGSPIGQSGDAFNQLVKMREQLDEMIAGMSGVAEQKNHGGAGANKVNDGGPTQPMIDEIEGEISDADVAAVLGAPAMDEEESVEESLTQTHANQKKVGGGTVPGKEYKSPQTVSRMRSGVQENKDPKISSLINENKGLTKKLNETKKYKQSVTTLVEQYKSALEKYRNQLKEMATFNTNLAHVNNLLVNESLALTQEDKIKIINEFKKVDTIAESQEKYKAILSEMKTSKPTLTESIEGKVSASVAPSSKQSLEEAKEVTAYSNDAHIQKMKKLIEYIENRGSKKII